MDLKKLLENRKKRKKPSFARQESHRRKDIRKGWRRPRGVHSKLRLRRRGKPARVSIGYKLPEAVRGLTTDGLKQVIISNPSHLKLLGKEQIGVVSSKVGQKKKLIILKEAQKAGIKLANVKDISAKITNLESKHKIKKEIKKKKIEEKARKEKDKKKVETKKKEEAVKEKKVEEKIKEEVKEKIIKAKEDMLVKAEEKPAETKAVVKEEVTKKEEKNEEPAPKKTVKKKPPVKKKSAPKNIVKKKTPIKKEVKK